MSVVSLVEGSVFAERYQVVRCIAAGGMGVVYEVTHIETQRRRALKVMHPHYLESEELRERFRLEAKVAAGIESEHIVEVFDAGVDAATQMPFLVIELLRGEELGRLLRHRGRFSAAEVVTYPSAKGELRGLAVDHLGHALAIGTFSADMAMGEHEISCAGGSDVFVAKLMP